MPDLSDLSVVNNIGIHFTDSRLRGYSVECSVNTM